MCLQLYEHISHIISGYSVLEANEYSNRHNKIAYYLHWYIVKKRSIPAKWHHHKQEKCLETDEFIFEQKLPTDQI